MTAVIVAILLLAAVAAAMATMPRACQDAAAMGQRYSLPADRSADCAAGWSDAG